MFIRSGSAASTHDRQLWRVDDNYYRNSLALASIHLESSSYRETEGFSRFAQQILRRKCALIELVTVLSGRAVRPWTSGKHVARYWNRRLGNLIEANRVVGPINAEGCIDDRKKNLQLKSSRCSRLPAATAEHRQILAEMKVLCPSTEVRNGILSGAAIGQLINRGKLPVI